MKRVIALSVLLWCAAASAQPQGANTGYDWRVPIETTESFTVMCDLYVPLDTASPAVVRRMFGSGNDPNDLVSAVSVTGLWDCSCSTCCVLATLDPPSCAVCANGNIYQVRLPADPTGAGTAINCNLRVDVKDVMFKVQ